MKRNRGRQGVRGGLLVIVVAVALALFSGCKPPQQVAPPPPEVSIVQPVSKEVTEWDDFTGRLEPIKSVEVRPRVSGYLDSIHFKDGQVVKAGDLLFVIDPRPYEAEAERARAELKRAEAQRNLGLQNLQRAERLMQGSTIAQEQFDTRRNEYDIAAANVLEAQAAAKAAELNLEFTQVKAPIDGRISRRFADEGNFITGGSAQSTLLTTIVPFDPLYATFDADERLVLKYTRLDLSGQRRTSREAPNPVRIALADEKDFSHEGKMNFVDNRLDPQTGTLRARALIDNSKGLLTPGLFVRVQLKGRGPYPALLIPDEAIGTDQSKKFVMVVDKEGLAQRRFITTGRLYDGLRTVEEGLTPEDRVIVGGMMRVRPGMPVKVKEAPPAKG
ncbi:MAG TPA: efflux RND transporter periplasmic adaptor subunit [Terrimicrobiaceae bacterium]|nr:efflux RND transporter periplasmic adaptor subunit [Terrimicrobiaceae bacterium]